MFRKPFQVKSNSLMKGSEKKKMKSDLKAHYPQMDPEALDSLIPSGKDEEYQVRKIFTHSGEKMLIYVFQKNPLFFSFEKDKKVIYPTVYALWKSPGLIASLYTDGSVLKNIQNGADLMCPGMVLPEAFDLSALKKGDIVSVGLTNNLSSIAIGYTAQSGEDMVQNGFRNKGVIIVHTYGDLLWQSGSQESPPLLEKSLSIQMNALEIEGDEETCSKEEPTSTTDPEADLQDEPEDGRSETEKMDDLLKSSFLTALKTSCKNVELPILTSNFYRVHMVEAARPAELNIKKSSFKKLGVFLSFMSSNFKIISVSELQKGVESIVSIDYDNEELRFHKVERDPTKKVPAPSSGNQFNPPVIEELYLVSAAVLQLFRPHPKKSVFTKASVREFLKDYVNKEQLASGPNVKLDPVLAGAVLQRGENDVTEMKWEELMERILDKMSPGYRINGEQRLGSISPIEMKTATRSGNKKVTLVYNLDLYGIDPHEVAHKCQVGVAASTSVDLKPPNRKKGSEVLIQGNQIAYVTKLLTEVYGINKKHLIGMEKAIKPKKNKK